MIPIFIGDETSAAGYRLAGLRTFSPEAGELEAVFRRACAETELLLLGVELARLLPAALLQEALQAPGLQVQIVPDLRQRLPMRDLPHRIRSQLGMKP